MSLDDTKVTDHHQQQKEEALAAISMASKEAERPQPSSTHQLDTQKKDTTYIY